MMDMQEHIEKHPWLKDAADPRHFSIRDQVKAFFKDERPDLFSMMSTDNVLVCVGVGAFTTFRAVERKKFLKKYLRGGERKRVAKMFKGLPSEYAIQWNEEADSCGDHLYSAVFMFNHYELFGLEEKVYVS